MSTVNLVEIQKKWAGLWVAVKDGEVVESRPTAHALVFALKDRDIVGATVFRCPSDDEAELVGLG